MLRTTAIDPRRTGRPYRFVYGNTIVGPRPCNSVTGSCRVDVTDGTVLKWSDLPNALPSGPPTFIPRPGAAEADENDGVILLDYLGADGRALMIILDGKKFVEVARVTVPYRHCVSTGSTWVWEAECASSCAIT